MVGIKNSNDYIGMAAEVARNSTCLRSKCGSVIVKSGEVIGRGFNSPPSGDEQQRRCLCPKSTYDSKVTDKTCCMHAEQRAIIDALKNHSSKLKGARLYFIRLDEKGHPKQSGQPYCTICSKMALDVGIAEFVLWQSQGTRVFDTKAYNKLSYQYSYDSLI